VRVRADNDDLVTVGQPVAIHIAVERVRPPDLRDAIEVEPVRVKLVTVEQAVAVEVHHQVHDRGRYALEHKLLDVEQAVAVRINREGRTANGLGRIERVGVVRDLHRIGDRVTVRVGVARVQATHVVAGPLP